MFLCDIDFTPTHLNRYYLSHKGTLYLANPVIITENKIKIRTLLQIKNDLTHFFVADMNYTFSNLSPSSSEMSICQICSWRRLQSFWESLLSSSSGSSECLLTKVRQFKKHLWKQLLIAGLALKIKSKVTIKYSRQHVFISLRKISLWSDRTVLQ